MAHSIRSPSRELHSELHSLQEAQERDDTLSVETVERPPSDISERQTSKPPNPLSIHVLALLIPASAFGLLARLGLDALATYDGNSIFPLAYAQAVGCLVMGFAVGLKEPFGNFYPPLYTALTTGFCGSLTTFSGWQLDVFDSWIITGQHTRGGLRDFIDGVGKSAFTLSISIASVTFGYRLAFAIYPYLPTISPPTRPIRYTITIISILTYAATLPTYFLMSPGFRHQATAALLFAFPGALTRYLLSVRLNTVLKAFPLGTFVVNSIGTALLGGFTVLQFKIHPVSPDACALIQGLIDGYCGCLTTVSTFAVEVHGLKLKKGARYALLSWTVGQVLLLLIFGSSIWSGHAREQATCNFV
ncbi:Fluoride export protein 1 [Hypsizygus marmoreus]|uniref:Fluoride export protein 1 n=1 Tax=Hypsizygus marmoreus TaxID=39966 RepID=A0A369JQ04_HYPMA|nr:Fluoride export protein 1 [Hypsizygus marmoreus]